MLPMGKAHLSLRKFVLSSCKAFLFEPEPELGVEVFEHDLSLENNSAFAFFFLLLSFCLHGLFAPRARNCHEPKQSALCSLRESLCARRREHQGAQSSRYSRTARGAQAPRCCRGVRSLFPHCPEYSWPSIGFAVPAVVSLAKSAAPKSSRHRHCHHAKSLSLHLAWPPPGKVSTRKVFCFQPQLGISSS